jgi:hypothetical protein
MRALCTDTLTLARQPEVLAATLEAVEHELGALSAALRESDAAGVESHAADLHRALASAIHRFTHASRQGSDMPQALRHRLALAGGQVAAQRECLARFSAALDRAIEVLMPSPLLVAVYGQDGQSGRAVTSGCLRA